MGTTAHSKRLAEAIVTELIRPVGSETEGRSLNRPAEGRDKISERQTDADGNRVEDETTRPSLTPRQSEVLTLLIDGRCNKEIAFKLGISIHTVKAHVSAVLRALRVPTRGRAAAVGRDHL